VLVLEKSGQPAGRLHSGRYGSVATIRRRQVSFAQGPAGAAWVVGVVTRKLEHQAATVLLISARHLTEAVARPALHRLHTAAERVAALGKAPGPGAVGEVAARLRGLEGAASATYFTTLNQALPPKLRFAGRSQHPAHDAFNCLLNYAYGVLYGQVEGALTRAGLDPYLGVLHRDEYNRPTLAYDLIEEFRVWADYVVLQLCLQPGVVQPDFFEVRPDGSWWLGPPGKRLLLQCLHDYLDEVVTLHQLPRSRATHLALAAQRLAQQVLATKEDTPLAATPDY
jgi:CRISPR-associated protein Cas1